MARITGSRGQIALTDESPAVVIASINTFTLNQARDYIEVTCFQDPNKTYVPGLPDVGGTFGGFYDRGTGSPEVGGNVVSLFAAAEGDVPVNMELTPDTNDSGHTWTGPAYLDVSITVDAKGAVSISGNFKASAGWQRN